MSDDASQTVPPSPPPGPAPGVAPADSTGTINERDRPLAVMTHLSALVAFYIPLANLIIPLVVWLVKRHESPDIDAVGREVVNFNLSMVLYFFAAFLLSFVLVGFLLMFALWVFGIVVTIIAAVRAHDGWRYRYPLTIRFL
jgi:uncharacterized protein